MFGLGHLFPRHKKWPEAKIAPSRVQKVMRTEETVGSMSASVPVAMEKLLEHFVQKLTSEAAEVAKQNNAKVLTPEHLRSAVSANPFMKFLEPIVAGAPMRDCPTKQKDVRVAMSKKDEKEAEEQQKETEARKVLEAAKAQLYGEVGSSSGSICRSESPDTNSSISQLDTSLPNTSMSFEIHEPTRPCSKRKIVEENMASLTKLAKIDEIESDDDDDDKFVESDGLISDEEDDKTTN